MSFLFQNNIYNYLFRFFFLYSVFNEQLYLCKLCAYLVEMMGFLLFHFHGGDDGIRTHDPLLAGQVLSQLSYTPIGW